MSFDAAAFGPITLNHLPPFAQRLRHAVHVEARMGSGELILRHALFRLFISI